VTSLCDLFPLAVKVFRTLRNFFIAGSGVWGYPGARMPISTIGAHTFFGFAFLPAASFDVDQRYALK
jgi:hypothetical protein